MPQDNSNDSASKPNDELTPQPAAGAAKHARATHDRGSMPKTADEDKQNSVMLECARHETWESKVTRTVTVTTETNYSFTITRSSGGIVVPNFRGWTVDRFMAWCEATGLECSIVCPNGSPASAKGTDLIASNKDPEAGSTVDEEEVIIVIIDPGSRGGC